MAKLSYEDKKEIIRMYEIEHKGARYIADYFKVNRWTVIQLINKYKLHGESSLLKKQYQTYSPKTKLEIITRAMNGESKTSLSIEYNIVKTQIINWLKKYEENGYNGLIDKPKGRPPAMKKEKKPIDPNDKDAIIKEKDQRILELEAEVAALKKLRALVLQRTQLKILLKL